MHFTYLASLAFAATAFATPVLQAPAAEINDVDFVLTKYDVIIANGNATLKELKKITSQDQVTAALTIMSGLSKKTMDVTEKLIVEINAKDGKMSLAATSKVAPKAGTVASTTVEIIQTLDAKKDFFTNPKIHSLVLEDMEKLLDVSKRFIKAAKAKIPNSLVARANPIFDQLVAALQEGVDKFKS